MSAVRIVDAVRQLRVEPAEDVDHCVVTFNGDGKPIHATLRECGHLDLAQIEQYAYLASGTFRRGTITRYEGRREENLTSILWLPCDADLADWLGMEREAIYALDDATLDDLIAKQRADLEEVFAALGIPIHRLDVTGYGLCAYVYVDPVSRDQIGPLREIHKRLVGQINSCAGYTLVDPQVSDAGTRITRLVPSLNVKGGVERPRQARTLVRRDGALDLAALQRLTGSVTTPQETPNPVPSALPDGVADELVAAIAPHWTLGQRHAVSLALAGMLAKAGVEESSASALIERLSAGDSKPWDRARTVADSYRRVRSGLDTKGFTGLKGYLPDDTLAYVDERLQRVRRATAPLFMIEGGASPELVRVQDEPPEFEWSEPIPLSGHELPPFPIETFTEPMRSYVAASATFTQTPLDLAATLGLGCLSTACAGKVEVEVRSGWSEQTNIYGACFLGPGNRKTGLFRSQTSTIVEYERTKAVEDRKERATWESRRKIREQTLARLQKEAAAAEGAARTHAEMLADAEALELAADRPPRITRLLVDDATPEKLASLLAEQNGAIAIMSAEGGFLGNIAGRYADKVPNYDVLLRGHAGDPIRIDRVGREGEYCPRPALTIYLCVQPAVLDDMAAVSGFREKGGLARFFFSLPESLVGHREIDPAPVAHELKAKWDELLLALLAMEPSHRSDSDGNRLPHSIRVAPAALLGLQAFQRRLEVRLGPEGDLHHIADWGAKLAGLCVRIAGLLHMADHAGTGEPWTIDLAAATMKRAIALGEDYCIPHALTAFERAGADPLIGQARIVLAYLCSHKQITRRDLFRAVKGTTKTLDQLDKVLRLLSDHGYIRVVKGGKPDGRPSVVVEVNPTQHAARQGQKDQKGQKERTALAFDTSDAFVTVESNEAREEFDL